MKLAFFKGNSQGNQIKDMYFSQLEQLKNSKKFDPVWGPLKDMYFTEKHLEIEDEEIDKKMREVPLEVENRDQRECMTINQKLQSIKESTEKKNPIKGARIGLSTDKTLKVTINNTEQQEH